MSQGIYETNVLFQGSRVARYQSSNTSYLLSYLLLPATENLYQANVVSLPSD